MTNCYWGVNFAGSGFISFSSIGRDLLPSTQQGNKWFGINTSSRLAGSQLPPNLYFFNYFNGLTQYDPTVQLTTAYNTNSFFFNASSSQNDNCSNGTYPQLKVTPDYLAQQRDVAFGVEDSEMGNKS